MGLREGAIAIDGRRAPHRLTRNIRRARSDERISGLRREIEEIIPVPPVVTKFARADQIAPMRAKRRDRIGRLGVRMIAEILFAGSV